VQVVADTEADRRPMDRRIVVQAPIEGHVCFDSKDDRFGARLVQLEESLSFCVPSEVFPLFIQAEKNTCISTDCRDISRRIDQLCISALHQGLKTGVSQVLIE
jgi:hypothetical protein